MPYPGYLPRILLVLHDMGVKSRVRIQHYGYVVWRDHRDEVPAPDYYADWRASPFGPHSMDLAGDIDQALRDGYTKQITSEHDAGPTSTYRLGEKGMYDYQRLSDDHEVVRSVRRTLAPFQKKSGMQVLRSICDDQPTRVLIDPLKTPLARPVDA